MKKLKKTISVAEARKRFAEILEEVSQGTIYVIVRHGKEMTRMMPPETDDAPRISPKLKKELASVFERYGDALKELADR